MADTWEDLPPASFQVGNLPEIKFPAVAVGEDGGNRLVRRERPFQEGAKLDGTGTKADEFSIDALFHVDGTEHEVDVAGDGITLWPDRLELLIEALKVSQGETGTLHLPWKRNLRVRAETWSRRANSNDNRGGETLQIKFIADNEDFVNRASVEKFSIKGSVALQVERAFFDLESQGSWLPAFEDITELASELAGLIALPGEKLQNILLHARRLGNGVQTVMDALTTAQDGFGDLAQPGGAIAMGNLGAVLEISAGASDEARSSLPATRIVKFQVTRDLFSIAAELGQDGFKLLGINGELETPDSIAPGTAVRVFV
jgi:prophage DNA circulation protein